MAVLLLATACGTPYLPARMPPEVPQPEGTKHAQGELEGVGKTMLYWQSWQPTKTPKRGALVVMHGLKDHSSRYADFAHALNDAGYAVYAFDLRGHGDSAGNRVNVLLFDDYVMDLDIFVSRTIADEDVPVFVFGHSMGGAIVALDDIMYHPSVRGIILSGAALDPGVSSFEIGLTKTTAALFPDFDIFNLDLDDFSRDPEVVKEGKRDPLVYQGAAPAHMAAQLVSGIRKIQSNMEQVDAPLLILHGKADRVTPPRGSKALYDRARSKDKTLTLYGNMFHDLLHEPEKAQVTSDIIAWMNARTK
jgi:alpha-beta hydrolase superfamily lysophospholipase